MASFNRVILVGNLTRDVEMRFTPQGTAVTDIGLAVNDRVKKQGEWVDETTSRFFGPFLSMMEPLSAPIHPIISWRISSSFLSKERRGLREMAFISRSVWTS